MRKIEQNMLNAVDALRHNRANASWSQDNTTAVNHVCLCGWNTPTTRSRLSALIRHFATPYDHATQGAEFVKRYPHGLGVSTKAGKVRIHDARGITEIDADGWHIVAL